MAQVRRRGPGKAKIQEGHREGNDIGIGSGETGLRRSFTVDGSQMDDQHGATRTRNEEKGTPGPGAKRMRPSSPGVGAPAAAESEEKVRED